MEEYSYYDKPKAAKKRSFKLTPRAKKIIGKTILYLVYAALVAAIIFLSVWAIGLALRASFAADWRKEFNELINAQYYSSVDMYIYLMLITATGIFVTILLVRDNLSKKAKKKVTHRY